MTPPAQYPKRDGFFAGKFCRLMTKVALANDLGTDVVCLLMVIAHQEDAAGYRGAVTWWNDQLKPLIGVKTDNALIRTRKKAVEAGWLHYEPGGKGVAGRYWVTIPAAFRDLDAAPVADSRSEYQELSLSPATGETGTSPVAGDRRSEGKVTGEVKGKRRGSDNHSSHTQEEESPTVSGDPPPAVDKPPRKEPTGPHADARRAFCERWRVRYGVEYRFVFGKHGKMLSEMLKHLGGSVEKLVEVFDRFFADESAYHAADSRHDFDSLNKNFNRWLVAAPLPRANSPPFARPATKAEALDDYFADQAASVFDGGPP